mmetsp:Transcript_1600/g.3263  ORF Transcript_1600/g.3263 Transcript_1600/m.3263 type:complete len:101 (-) Transcript_1600:428-730(-)
MRSVKAKRNDTCLFFHPLSTYHTFFALTSAALDSVSFLFFPPPLSSHISPHLFTSWLIAYRAVQMLDRVARNVDSTFADVRARMSSMLTDGLGIGDDDEI